MGEVSKNSKIIMVSGKGGVGKSTYSFALAQKLAQEGYKTLLVEVGKYSYFSKLLNRPSSYEGVSIGPNLVWRRWKGEDCLEEYVGHLIKITKVAKLFFNNPVMKSFVDVAPGLKELAITGKLTSGIRNWGPEFEYDRIVFDGFATGHFLSLLSAPQAMGQIIKKGPMGHQSRSIMETLTNSQYTQVHIVTLPEEFPTQETIEFQAQLKGEFGIHSKVFMNKVIPESIAARLENESSESLFIRTLKGKVELQRACIGKLELAAKLPLIVSSHSNKVCELLSKEIHWDN